MCLPKIYMNASQYEEVKDGARGVKGMPRRSREWRFLPLTGRMKKATIVMEVMFAAPSKSLRPLDNQSSSFFPLPEAPNKL